MRKFLCKLFGHRWGSTAVNSSGCPIEQSCHRCNVYRHHFYRCLPRWFEDDVDWLEGRHPGPRLKCNECRRMSALTRMGWARVGQCRDCNDLLVEAIWDSRVDVIKHFSDKAREKQFPRAEVSP